MAKPREIAKSDPPVESEEEEEEEESGEEEEDSESEPESPEKQVASTPAPAPKKPEPSTPQTQPAAAASSSSSDESGSDTDSESPTKTPDPNIKPIATKPMDDFQKTTAATKKPRSKLNSSGPTSPTKPTNGAGAKRLGPGGDEEKDSKRQKKKSEAEDESLERKGNSNDDSRKLFQRLWSEDDEIAILKGMLDYSAKKKADPVTDLNAFHEFIKKNLHIDVTRTQLQDKIRRLRKKYQNIAKKEKKGNKERTFSKPHEQKTYDLSKKVWGNEKTVIEEEKETNETLKFNGTAVRKSRSRSAVGTTPKVDEAEEKLKEVKDLVMKKDVVEGSKNVSFGPDNLRIEEWIMKNGMDFIKDEKKRAEMEEKWRELKVKEIELLARRSELMAEQSKLILDGLR